tara:strand:+ start:259 stop:579 length:321 start_codon:yes stop_codon:yes gene_type:complete
MFLVDVKKVWSWIVENRNLVLATVCFVVLSVFLLSSCTEEENSNITFTEEGVEAEIIDAAPPTEQQNEQEGKQELIHDNSDENKGVTNHAIRRENFVNAYTIVSNN